MGTYVNEQLGTDEILCWNCGNGMSRQSTFCPACGTAMRADGTGSTPYRAGMATGVGVALPGGKSKSTAIILAILVGCFAWLYTWKVDKVKFLVALGGLVLLTLLSGSGDSGGTGVLSLLWAVGAYVWVICDCVRRPAQWYSVYDRS